jgi:HSP20 family protein
MTSMSRLREEMNRLLEDFFGETMEERAPAEMMRVPSIDVIDQGDNVLVRAEMPGIDKEKLQVQAMPEALTIHAEMRKEHEEKSENVIRKERRLGMFQRVVPMPVEILPNEVKASYTDGVLEVTLPKSEQAKSRKPVEVKIE